jgi:DNA-directed RNA polymerase I subunit RPA2
LPQIESFDSLFEQLLLKTALEDIPHVAVFGLEAKLTLWVTNPVVAKPMLLDLYYPAECRERGITYKAKMQATLNWRLADGKINCKVIEMGHLPIMVKSSKCNLNGKTPAQLVNHHEDPEEFGGYFISNGIERLIRLLIVPRRNHPTALIRTSFQNRGNTYSHFGVQIRSVRPDQTSQTVTLHYCTDGQITLRFSYRKNEYMVPILLILKSLSATTDLELFERITMGNYKDTFLTDRGI